MVVLDKWQKEIIEDETNHILLAKGRRIGATHTFAMKAVEWLMTHHNPHPSSQIVCSSITEDQAQLIISFALDYAIKKYKKYIGKGKDKPTLNRLVLIVDKNRRILIAKPVGSTGASARGFEGQVLMVDEGGFQPDLFWDAAKPILATTGGRIWTWGTFNGRDGYFWKAYEKAQILKDPQARFKVWEKNTEEVLNERQISESWTEAQREGLRKHLEEEREEMSEQAYAQEYLAVAALDKKQFYSDAWIDRVCTLDKNEKIDLDGDFYAGFDLARMGGDQFTSEVMKRIQKNNIIQVDHYTRKLLLTTDNEDLICEYSRKWKTRKSGIDAGSGTLGVSVYDHLQLIPDMKHRVVAMNNRAMSLENEDGKQRLFNEDMHDNLRAMGERGEIKLFNDPEVKNSLRSVQWDLYKDAHGLTKVKISGRFTHIAEGIVRAAYLANQKSLNLRIMSF
ncbi:MAG: hypothetical protein WC346_12460 [Methanogenium sp.]|jgi:hypothetical protein